MLTVHLLPFYPFFFLLGTAYPVSLFVEYMSKEKAQRKRNEEGKRNGGEEEREREVRMDS